MDKCCSEMKDPSKHTKFCARMEECEKSGYGISVKQLDGSFLFYLFDEDGHKAAMSYLDSTSREDNLSIKVRGLLKENILSAVSISEQ